MIETNEDIEWLVGQLNNLIISLRKKNPTDKKLLKFASNFYQNVVAPWYEKYKFLKQELEPYDDEEMKNQILDLTNKILRVLK